MYMRSTSSDEAFSMAEPMKIRSVAGWMTPFLCLAASAALGCSSNNATNAGQDGDGGLEDAVISCAHDPRVETFSEGMMHKGDSGKLSFVIASSNFNPPAVDNNTWTLKVLDASGKPVTDATLTFPKGVHPSDPWMPDHTHGTLPVKPKNNADGTYVAAPLYFFMGGVWSTLVSATSGSVTDTTTFTFCVGS
jgi:hypothetical protein